MKISVPFIRNKFVDLKLSIQQNIINKKESEISTQCNIEKHINNFYINCSDCKDCNIKRGVKRYFDNKDEISIQQKTYFKKNRQIITETKRLQKQKKR